MVRYVNELGEMALSIGCSLLEQGERRLRVITIGDVNNMLNHWCRGTHPNWGYQQRKGNTHRCRRKYLHPILYDQNRRLGHRPCRLSQNHPSPRRLITPQTQRGGSGDICNSGRIGNMQLRRVFGNTVINHYTLYCFNNIWLQYILTNNYLAIFLRQMKESILNAGKILSLKDESTCRCKIFFLMPIHNLISDWNIVYYKVLPKDKSSFGGTD